MRVTENTFPTLLVNQLGQWTTQQNRLQTQAATGQRIQLPEDDPASFRRTLELQTESGNVSQYLSNIGNLRELATVSFDAMKGLKQISDRAGEIATLADGTKSPEELSAYATEMSQLIAQDVQVANSQHLGAYVFAGTRSDTPPFVSTTDSNGNVTSVSYQGNDSTAQVDIAEGVSVGVLVPGVNNSGAGASGLITDSRTGADFFAHLISLRDHLQAGDVASVASTDRGQLGKDEENLMLQYSNNGAVQARLDSAESILNTRSGSLSTLISHEADADLSQTLVQLNEAQNAYRAALQSGATMLHESLLNYLK
jgi:flagellar hook-associated protein 3 FlgL